jgi:hypothetical protein
VESVVRALTMITMTTTITAITVKERVGMAKESAMVRGRASASKMIIISAERAKERAKERVKEREKEKVKDLPNHQYFLVPTKKLPPQ